MQDLISIADTLLMVSGTALAIALTIAPLAYAFIKSGQTEAPVQVTVATVESVAFATIDGKDEDATLSYAPAIVSIVASQKIDFAEPVYKNYFGVDPARVAPTKVRSGAKSKGAIVQVPKDDTQ